MEKVSQHIHVKTLNIFLALALAFAFVPIAPKAEAGAVQVEEAEQTLELAEGTFEEDHVVVKFKDSPESDSAVAVLQEADTVKDAKEASINDIGDMWATVDVEDGKTVEEAINELKNDPRVEDVIVDNYMELLDEGDVELSANVNDPQAGYQWYLSDSNAKVHEAWDVVKCDGNVTVAIIDSGMDADHPDLVNNTIAGTSVISDSYDDQVGHGTCVAGVISAQANNGVGVAGVSYNSKILPVKVTDAMGFNASNAAKAINWCVANKNAYNIKVINMSFGTTASNSALRDAVNSAVAAGILCVCASGNNGTTSGVLFPASMDNTISVGAIDSSHTHATYSNGGSNLDVVASGTNIFTTIRGGEYSNYTYFGDSYQSISGTSFACPFVAATAALCFAKNSAATPEFVKMCITETAKDLGDSGKDDYYGYGQVVVKDAIERSTYEVLYRLYNPYSGEHLFTKSTSEYAALGAIGWQQEGVSWTSPYTSTAPVYRLYNPYSGDHHYTTEKSEYVACGNAGWRQEGIAWYSDVNKGASVYRLFNPYVSIGTHHYTTSEEEYNNLTTYGWRQEGVGWYGLK